MQIAILVYEGLTALDAIGPYEVLSRVPGARILFVSTEAGPVRTDTRMLTLVSEQKLAQAQHPDVLVVPGGLGGTFTAARDPRVLEWIRTADETSLWTTSVCSGSLILGAAGLLRDRRASTHWRVADRLARYGATYARGRVVEDGKIITAAGVSAGIDMGLHLASRLAGPEVASAIQLVIEYDPQPPFDTGSVPKAGAAVRKRAERMLARAYASEVARRAVGGAVIRVNRKP